MRLRTVMSSSMRVAVLGLGALVLVAWAAPAGAQPAVYMRSNVGAPWDQPEPTDHMDDVFGAGNWQLLFYETANPAVVFSAPTTFVYMQGGDNNADELEAFLTANLTTIQNWVTGGGRLLVNAAPNEGNGMSYGFGGVVLVYDGTSDGDQGVAASGFHPVFNGPFRPLMTSYTGNSFSHAYVIGGGLTPIILDEDGRSSLAELAWGSGHALFGGLTTSNWWDPQPEADNLDRNIIAYAATLQPQGAAHPIPTLGAWALVLLVALVAGAGILVIRRLT